MAIVRRGAAGAAALVMTPIQRARSQLLLKYPFWAALVLATPLVEDRTIATAGTDMTTIWYNPDFLDSLEAAVVLFVLVHEAMHIMLKHGLRMKHRDAGVWNIACDHVINLKLKEWGFTLWPRCCAHPRFKGMGAEEVYAILLKEQEERGGSGRPGDHGDEGQGGMGDDLVKPSNTSREAADEVDRAINRKIVQAQMVAKMAGKMPADLDRMLNAIRDPKIPWYDELQEFLQAIMSDDETWTRRNRRFSNIYLPGKRAERIGEIVFVEDTSGSMSNTDLAKGAAEINGIAAQVRPERIRVVWTDDKESASVQVFERGEPMEFHPVGGGGTDMRKPLKYVEQYDPIVVIMFTDGYTPWPTVEPDYPLIVVCTTDAPCPVGRVIRMKDEV